MPLCLDPEFEFEFAFISLCATDTVNAHRSAVDSDLSEIASERHVCGNTVLADPVLKTSEFTLALSLIQNTLFALTKFINILIPLIVLTACLAWRLGNHRIGRFLASTLVYLVCDGSLFTANSLVENWSAVYWLIRKIVLFMAIVAALVVFREVSPL